MLDAEGVSDHGTVPPPRSSFVKTPLSISGTAVGILDPSQPERLLSTPYSKLSFATFHPRTAGHANPTQMTSQDILCTSKRIVVETLPSGESFWRWVPRARNVQSVEEEGHFPRVVNICGDLVHISQEQWDIYKLDPAYECYVHPVPKLTVISRKSQYPIPTEPQPQPQPEPQFQPPPQFQPQPQPQPQPPPEPQPSVDAHTRDEISSDEEMERARKKRRYAARVDTDSEEGEVIEMIDAHRTEMPRRPPSSRPKSQRRTRRHPSGRTRPATPLKGPDDIEELSMVDLTLEDTTPPEQPFSPPPPRPPAPEAPQDQRDVKGKRTADDTPEQPKKRHRARSPPNYRRPKRAPPKAKEKYAEWERMHRAFREEAFLQSLFEEAAKAFQEQAAQAEDTTDMNGRATPDTQVPHTQEPPPPQEPPEHPLPSEDQRVPPEPEVEDPISLEEKVRRVAEIEAYERKRAAEKARREREAKEAAERVRRERELRARLERERQERERQWAKEERRRRKIQQHLRWIRGYWSQSRAIEWYKTLSETFDKRTFSPEDPISFYDVPWPMLVKPTEYTAQDIDWSKVEEFFEAAKFQMRPQEYQALVEKSHKRFHPDRWRARRILLSIEDEEERSELEVAANTVAQAITPIWRKLKD